MKRNRKKTRNHRENCNDFSIQDRRWMFCCQAKEELKSKNTDTKAPFTMSAPGGGRLQILEWAGLYEKEQEKKND